MLQLTHLNQFKNKKLNAMTHRSTLSSRLTGVLNPATLLPNLAAGLTVGILNVMVSISFGAMIFSGRLSEFTSRGIGFLLTGTIILGLVPALFSTFPGILSGQQDGPSAIVAVMAGIIAGEMSGTLSPQQTFITVVMVIVITSAVTGLCFMLLGRFHMGN